MTAYQKINFKLSKLKILYSTISAVKGLPMEGKKMFANHISVRSYQPKNIKNYNSLSTATTKFN